MSLSTKEQFKRIKLLLEERSKGYDAILLKYKEQKKKHTARMEERFRIETEKMSSAFREKIEDLSYDLKSLRTRYNMLEKSLEVSNELNKCKNKKLKFQEQNISSLRENVRSLEETLEDSQKFEKLFTEAKEEILRLQDSVKTERRKSVEMSNRMKREMSREMSVETDVLRKKLEESQIALRNKTRDFDALKIRLRMKNRTLNKFAMNVIRKNIGYWIRAWKERRENVEVAVKQFQKNEASYVVSLPRYVPPSRSNPTQNVI